MTVSSLSSLDKFAAALVADALLFGLVELHVEVPATLRTDPAAGEPADEFLPVDIEEDDQIQLGDVLEVLRLREVSRVAVEDESAGVLEGGLDDFVDEGVGDQFAGFDVLPRRAVFGLHVLVGP